jgi:hypothetical protein
MSASVSPLNLDNIETLDLFQISAPEVRDLIDGSTDPAVIRILWDLHDSIASGDEAAQIDAVDSLTGLLVYERGGELEEIDAVENPL